MKKSLIFIILMLVMFSTLLSAWSIVDLPDEEREIVKNFAISVDAEITESNFEEVEYLKYEIVLKLSDYIVIEIDGYFYIISTEDWLCVKYMKMRNIVFI